jgi:hypothetical protein
MWGQTERRAQTRERKVRAVAVQGAIEKVIVKE